VTVEPATETSIVRTLGTGVGLGDADSVGEAEVVVVGLGGGSPFSSDESDESDAPQAASTKAANGTTARDRKRGRTRISFECGGCPGYAGSTTMRR
jgi:hypothetical protein